MYDNATKVVGAYASVCTSVLVCVCILKGDVCIKMGFFTLNGAREVKAFHSERQRRAGGGDMASGNLDSPVVYL